MSEFPIVFIVFFPNSLACPWPQGASSARFRIRSHEHFPMAPFPRVFALSHLSVSGGVEFGTHRTVGASSELLPLAGDSRRPMTATPGCPHVMELRLGGPTDRDRTFPLEAKEDKHQ
ncbi:hypothetical protein LZ30DRAFT_718871 [Colletotrichum cereale]|nr:hypothetical protein LZ30DRAFT_718871 [Colletotrichum cereale]